MKAQLTPAFLELQASLGPLILSMKNLAAALEPLTALIGPLAAAIGFVLVSQVNALMSAFALVLPLVTYVFNDLALVITGIITVVTDVVNIIANLLQGNWAAAWESAKKLVTDVLDVIESRFRLFVTTITNFVSKIVGDIIQWFQDLYNKLVGSSIIPELVAKILALFNTLWIDVVKKVIAIRDDLIATFKEMVDGIVEKVKDILAAVTNMLDDIVTKIKEYDLAEAAWDLIQGFIDGILNSVEDVKNAIVSMVKSAIAAAIAALNGGSPSRVFIAIGKTVPQGMALGILAGQGEVGAAVVDMLDITGVLAELEKYIKDIVAFLVRMAGYFAQPKAGVGSAKAVVDALQPIFGGLGDILEGVQAVLSFELVADATARVDAVIGFLTTAHQHSQPPLSRRSKSLAHLHSQLRKKWRWRPARLARAWSIWSVVLRRLVTTSRLALASLPSSLRLSQPTSRRWSMRWFWQARRFQPPRSRRPKPSLKRPALCWRCSARQSTRSPK
jgi:phage-related minor tail protein